MAVCNGFTPVGETFQSQTGVAPADAEPIPDRPKKPARKPTALIVAKNNPPILIVIFMSIITTCRANERQDSF